MSCKYVHCYLRGGDCRECENWRIDPVIESHSEAATRIVKEELEAEKQ